MTCLPMFSTQHLSMDTFLHEIWGKNNWWKSKYLK